VALILPTWVKFSGENPTFQATMTGKTGQSNAVKWDGQEYSISNLTWRIFTNLHPQKKEYGGQVALGIGLTGADAP
jgi:hypothetical protein